MAKSQKRSNREVRKPKASKAKPAVVIAASADNSVSTLMARPLGKR